MIPDICVLHKSQQWISHGIKSVELQEKFYHTTEDSTSYISSEFKTFTEYVNQSLSTVHQMQESFSQIQEDLKLFYEGTLQNNSDTEDEFLFIQQQHSM